MPDSGNVDAALIATLLNDSQLMTFATDGVWFDVAKKNATKFVLVSLLHEGDVTMFGGRAFEQHLYLVKAVALASTGADVRSAAARIDALLATPFTITGYSIGRLARVERVRYTEVDEDNDARWQHRGGHYELWASPS